MTIPSNFHFSQGSLQDFVDCPRRFQLKYIEKLSWPALETEQALEGENYMQQGAAFHRMVHQYLLGVSIANITQLAQADPKLKHWWENFLNTSDKLEGLSKLSNFTRYTEILLNAPLGEYRLVGKYDLLVISENQFIIYDWKTARKQPNRKIVETNLQTRVYPYLLVKAGTYLNNYQAINPSQIKMIYWFTNFPTSPLNYIFSENQFNEDQRFIDNLIEEIQLLDDSPAQMTNNIKRCRFCTYRSLCNRGTKAGSFDEIENTEELDLGDFDLDFDQIAEIEYS